MRMATRTLVSGMTVLLVAGLALARQKDAPSSGSWSGVIINGNCSATEAFAESAKCTEKGLPGMKLSFYDDTLGQVYDLEPQERAAGHLGDSVTIDGTLDGRNIQVSSLKLLTAIGLAVGQVAPAFSAPDQFGREQSLDRLKGPNGTVLLFFRSADW